VRHGVSESERDSLLRYSNAVLVRVSLVPLKFTIVQSIGLQYNEVDSKSISFLLLRMR